MEAAEPEASAFDTSHALGLLISSTPLLSHAWNQCNTANQSLTENFTIDVIGNVGYLAFSGIQPVQSFNSGETQINDLFSPLTEYNREPSLVHTSFLNLFLDYCNKPNFQYQILSLVNRTKSLVLTGHSTGGTVATLATLWLLCTSWVKTKPALFCITFGSPMVGNQSLAKSILRERWGGKFCHVVMKHDPVPMLMFSPVAQIAFHLNHLFEFWQSSMKFPAQNQRVRLSDGEKIEFWKWVLKHVGEASENEGGDSSYRPFGSYLFCSGEGAICIESPVAVVRMMYVMFRTCSVVDWCMEEHVGYGEVVGRISEQLLRRKSIAGAVPESGYDAGIALALEAAGIGNQNIEASTTAAIAAAECLRSARRMGLRPNINSAQLAISLSKITPHRAQIEWYKTSCEEHPNPHQPLPIGYYDSFKLRRSPKKDFKVNHSRIRLENFWNELINKIETDQLPHDFHRRDKWINSAHFYKLLVEPLDIAEYYRTRKGAGASHYRIDGRPRRYCVFDEWWREREKTRREWDVAGETKRTKWAGLTQDSCFWAQVEEAKEWVEEMVMVIEECRNGERYFDGKKRMMELWKSLEEFERYAGGLVERKEVSKDVVLPGSGYGLWIKEWQRVKLMLQFSDMDRSELDM